MNRRRLHARFWLAVLAGAWSAPQPSGAEAVFGFRDSAASKQLALEQRFTEHLEPSRLRESMRELSAKPHHTGSPAGRAVAESIAAKFRSWGFETRIETVYALMPTPKDRVVAMIAPRPYRARLEPPAIPGHEPGNNEGSLPPYNAYSADGEVTADAVYVNYGLREDYAELERLGVDVRGKIVIARYGRAFRGMKPRLAGEMGAVGTILYSDPADYGYRRGVVYPEGPYLPSSGYQRGSVINATLRTGDPLTPGVGATSEPDGFSLDQAADVISPVPVQPLSADDVHPILAAMTGPAAPAEWQGALPITYRLGGTVRLRLEVQQDWRTVPVHNVVAMLRGDTWPDEWVLRGNNHDAWNYGAMVPLSGLVTLLEEARAIGRLAADGWGPRRTLVYLAWDGEEQGLLGSTEWVETHADILREKAVVYVNSGITTQGFFEAGGSPALERMVDEVARTVRDPKLNVPVYDRLAARMRLEGESLERYRLAPPGLASDWTPFIHHLGIASLDYAFEGEADSGVYHSIYDTFEFFERFGDPGYRYGVALAEANGRTMLRLANAEVLPFDFTGTADAIAGYVTGLEALVVEMRERTRRHNLLVRRGVPALADDPDAPLAPAVLAEEVPPLELGPLDDAAAGLARSAERYAEALAAFRASPTVLADAELVRLNGILRQSERRLAPAEGLPGRPWYRHLLYAPGHYTGHAVKTLPGVREAVERRQWPDVEPTVRAVARAIGSYATEADRAAEVLEKAVRQARGSQEDD
jgi:N-acetylated-alpha-linked acidic dipeptidase